MVYKKHDGTLLTITWTKSSLDFM